MKIKSMLISTVIKGLIIAGFSLQLGCEAIFEDNLENEKLYLIIPMDSLVTDVVTHTFWWEPVDEAEFYNLQIVSPGFDSLMKLVVDTNLSTEKFEYVLYPGRFQWRVRAYNYSSSTDYFIRTLFINNTFDLSQQQVVLKSPAINLVTNDTTILFEWFEINNATDYRFEIKYNTWEGDYVINPILSSENSLTLHMKEGTYVWGVQAQNQHSSSIFSTRSVTIDTTCPAIPLLLQPLNNDTIKENKITFLWIHPDTSGSVIRDSLYISPDSLFMDQQVIQSFLVNDLSFSFTISSPGIYFWKIRSIDVAGNRSDYSQVRKFTYTNEE